MGHFIRAEKTSERAESMVSFFRWRKLRPAHAKCFSESLHLRDRVGLGHPGFQTQQGMLSLEAAALSVLKSVRLVSPHQICKFASGRWGYNLSSGLMVFTAVCGPTGALDSVSAMELLYKQTGGDGTLLTGWIFINTLILIKIAVCPSWKCVFSFLLKVFELGGNWQSDFSDCR